MFQLVGFKIAAAAVIFLMTAFAAYFPFKQKISTLDGHDYPRGEALACGIFLGAGLIHMLGSASYQFQKLGVTYPLASLLCGTCFLMLLLLEHYGSELKVHQTQNTNAIAKLSVVMLSFHALFAGAALGLSFSFATTVLILAAILSHKWAESFSLAIQLNKSSIPIRQTLIYFAIFSIMTPLGICIGTSVQSIQIQHNYLEPLFTSLAAGTFLYIGTLHGLKRSVMVERCCDLNAFFYVIVGFALMAISALWA